MRNLLRKLFNRKVAFRLIRYEVAIIVAVLATQILMLFFSQNRILVIQKRGVDTWQDIAETAEGQNSACQLDLQQALDDKHAAILANNPDLK